MAILAWQGWQTTLPEQCEPVSVSGSFDAGQVLLADLLSPRIGLRWERPAKRTTPRQWSAAAMAAQVGQLAAAEARKIDSPAWTEVLCYREPNPPGRNVWVGHSRACGRAVIVIEHVGPSGGAFVESLPENLQPSSPSKDQPWAVLGLSCKTPPAWRLIDHGFLAGDLSLTFSHEKSHAAIRQVALADVALRRMPLERWLNQRRRTFGKSKNLPAPAAVELRCADGRLLRGLKGSAARRAWRWGAARQRLFYALHDVERNKLVFVESDQADVAEALAKTSGWAQRTPQPAALQVATCG